MGLHKGEQPAGSQEQTDDQVRRQALKGEVSAEIFTEKDTNFDVASSLNI